MISDELTKLYEGTNERVGFILATGETVECKNVSLTPDVAFEVSGEDLMLYADDAVSTWHTHPNDTNNLSAMDHDMFVAWHTMTHFIIGTNGVKEYTVSGRDVLIA